LMDESERVLKIVRAVEDELKLLEERVVSIRAILENTVSEAVSDASRELERLVEDERRRAIDEAEREARAEAEQIRREYAERSEKVKARLAESREELIELVIKALMGG
jgi:F0F1-type ATP synthase membrane subunit b/b'